MAKCFQAVRDPIQGSRESKVLPMKPHRKMNDKSSLPQRETELRLTEGPERWKMHVVVSHANG